MRRFFSALNRAQQTTGFKIGASVLAVLLAVGVAGGDALFGGDDGVENLTVAQQERAELVRGMLQTSDPMVLVGGGALAGLIVSVIIIWLGLALTYLGLLVLSAAIAVPMLMFEPTKDYGVMVLGVAALTCAFAALLQGMRLVFSLPGSVFAIARNVLAEAVRLKLSVVFIVLLVLAMATLPQVFDSDNPLRYRMQSFLQYSTGGSFWIIALLTLFFSAGTVAFEQRDKIIWQTMTKPVAPWKYILGKWLGVAGLVAVLLAVSASGVFLAAEYFRRLPAAGEFAPYQTRSGEVSEDRMILETQVLAARTSVNPGLEFTIGDERFTRAVEARIEQERLARQEPPGWRPPASEIAKWRTEAYNEAISQFLSIEAGRGELFTFEGLGHARDSGRPLQLAYRVDAEGNRPDRFYEVSFVLPGNVIVTRTIGLGYTHTLEIAPEFIDPQGRLFVEVVNGKLVPSGGGLAALFVDDEGLIQQTMSFPPGGIQVSYNAGSYHMNFLRVIGVLWVKLAFLAMIAIFAATFMSFPVACLVAVGVFLMAEGAGFIASSIEVYSVKDHDGDVNLIKVMVVGIAQGVSSLFSVYADLRPTGRLVDGRLLGWGDAARGVSVLAIASTILYFAGVFVFRRRELAIYSGH